MNINYVSSFLDKKFIHGNRKWEIYAVDICQEFFIAVPLDAIPVDNNIYQSLEFKKIKISDICLIYFL